MGLRQEKPVFPDPVYAEVVLEPLFRDVRRHFLDALCRINRAHCIMLCETGILTESEGSSISAALVEIEARIEAGSIVYSPEREDVFFAIEAELARLLGSDLAGRLHAGRSRNDIDHTMFRLRLRDGMHDFIAAALKLAEALYRKALREAETIIVAYTHGQPAQPTTFGHYLFGVLEILLRDIERLQAAHRQVDECPMGVGAITTTGFPIDRQRMAALLGFREPTENAYASIAGVDYLTSTYAAVKLVVLHLGRTIQDMQFWTSFEVSQLRAPDGLVQISSIMPQKRNPVAIEHMRLLASKAMGEAESVISAMHNTPFTDINDSEAEMQMAGSRAFETANRLLRLFSVFIDNVTVDNKNVARNIDRSCITITELADDLVRRENISFRQAHEVCAEVSRSVLSAESTLHESGFSALEFAFREKVGHPLSVEKHTFLEVVAPEHFVAVRGRKGGPASGAMEASSRKYRFVLDELYRDVSATAEWRSEALSLLDAEFQRVSSRE